LLLRGWLPLGVCLLLGVWLLLRGWLLLGGDLLLDSRGLPEAEFGLAAGFEAGVFLAAGQIPAQ
jgi:hypothetical protein